MKADKFKTNPVAKKIKVESKVKLSPKEKKIKEDLEREWESILLNDKKKALDSTDVQGRAIPPYYSTFDEYSWYEKVYKKGCNDGYKLSVDNLKITNKITWVLTAVNVGILISLVIKNV